MINNYKTAYFVMYPTKLEELKEEHTLPEETPYEIVKEIIVSNDEYNAFIEDFKVDRSFLKDNSADCEEGYIMYCLYIHCPNEPKGLLVVSDVGKSAMVKWAAYIEE